ncbi:MAG TPA: sulfotransferase [Longimicrobiaceae bacterium]|nr:sulfotransferase [Longimicrobiaceae bacterium]
MGDTRECTGRNLVFLVGAPRSGTTWLQRLLASHPQIRTGQETHLFNAYIYPLLRSWRTELAKADAGVGRSGVGLPCYFTEEEYFDLVREFLYRILEGVTRDTGPGAVFLEKTPAHARFIPEIKSMLREARFIHVIRDPRDVAASLLAAGQGWGRAWAPTTIGPAARKWVEHACSARAAAGELSASEYIEVRYEDLLTSPVERLGELAEFMGLEWSNDAIRCAIDANEAEALRKGGGTPIPVRGAVAERRGNLVSEPVGFVRAARAGSWRSDLSFRQKLHIWRKIRPIMAEYGYSWPIRDWF